MNLAASSISGVLHIAILCTIFCFVFSVQNVAASTISAGLHKDYDFIHHIFVTSCKEL